MRVLRSATPGAIGSTGCSRSNAWIWDFLSTNNGSVDSLNVSLRWGCRSKAVRILRIVLCDRPVSAAMVQIDQWVASLGTRVQRALDHLGHLRVRHSARPTGAVFIGEPFDPILHETSAPFSDSVFMGSEPGTDLLAVQPVRTEQDYAAAVRKRSRRLVTSHLCFKKGSLIVAHNHLVRHSPHHRILSSYMSENDAKYRSGGIGAAVKRGATSPISRRKRKTGRRTSRPVLLFLKSQARLARCLGLKG